METETAHSPETHIEITVRGVVQGIGFRPFVFRLAERHGLRGYVVNHGRGVTIRAQGPAVAIERFVAGLSADAPAPVWIEELQRSALPSADYDGFAILESARGDAAFTQISPDLALCAECRRDLANRDNRRYRYPFTNCTQCGPRFTIIQGLPYDRPQTTMRPFVMCEACAAEYREPRDRRFHAQPNACPHCGPTLRLLLQHRCTWHSAAVGHAALHEAAQMLSAGSILMVQGLGGFHLACDATNDASVRRLRERKRREEKPLAVMFPSLSAMEQWCDTTRAELRELRSVRSPIVLVRKRRNCPVAESVSPGNPLLGALLPYTPLHVELTRSCNRPLVMTSANYSEEPIHFRVERALEAMGSVADAALLHDRAIHQFADDSVVRVIDGSPRVWRRSRGYVPQAVPLKQSVHTPVLALGADLKNAFCIAKERSAILSQHLGDMQDAATIAAQQYALSHFLRIYDLHPGLVACDLHPDYTTTALAEEYAQVHGLQLIRVQHHHAHLAACLAEHGESGPVVGLTLDGTGFGTDGTIWGGELLYGGIDGFERRGTLESIEMPGNELAAREPWRMALAWLVRTHPSDWDRLKLPLLSALHHQIGERPLGALAALLAQPNRFARTSSVGRLFDAVAALTQFGARRQYEGQAATELEGALGPGLQSPYPVKIACDDGIYTLSVGVLIEGVVEDSLRGRTAALISGRFHESIVQGYVEMVRRVAAHEDSHTVALSGGCFQNAYLLSRFEHALGAGGFRVLSHRDVPPNDGGIALGQVCIANAKGDN
ncbi:carbamoyltransferase HypF [candidate division KSB1 bacterium]|nr:carbamoyltransferase HypF [candidate division KSB1 bacterium]